MQLEIPLPPKILSPNARSHWAAKSKAAKAYKSDCYYVALSKPFQPEVSGAIHIHVQWHPKTAHAFDEDNAIASLKHAFDGIAQAWRVNDSRFTISFEKMPPVKGGKVLINAKL